MADHLLNSFKQNIDELIMLPSDGGRFEVEVNGELIYSKLRTGQFPGEGDIERAVRERS